MRIRVYTDGDPTKDGCAYYRTHLPGTTLADQGADVIVERGTAGVLWRDDVLVNGARDPRVQGWSDPDCDVAVFQRPVHRDVADLIEWCAADASRPRTVVDLDDDLYKIPRENKAYRYVQPSLSPLRNTDHLRRAVRAADLVTVTTPALARRYARGRSVVLPNYVPASYLRLPPRPLPAGPVSVGWTGTLHTHPHDLESTKGGVATALLRTGAAMHVVGDGERVREALVLPDTVSLTTTGWVPLPLYTARMNEIDVGIVPLHASAFNQGKSWLKGLEMSALGIPFVASNTQPYVELHRAHGLGLIARSPHEWTEKLTLLIRDEDYRITHGEAARETVAASFTIEQNAERWLDAWTSVPTNAYARL
jgi:glycosyltransferase involved in cell wall biosynthesis